MALAAGINMNECRIYSNAGENYGDSVDIRQITNGDLSGIEICINGELRYNVICEVKMSWKSRFLEEKFCRGSVTAKG